MPYINNKGVRIHYQVDGNGQGPPLIMVHGLVGCLEDFYEYGWIRGLAYDYRLILLDVRGHGHSDKPHNPDLYKFDLRVADILAVLDDLGVSRAHYMGFSMGGQIGYAMAQHAPERLISMIILGAHPYSRTGRTEHWRSIFSRGIEYYVEQDLKDPYMQKAATDWWRVRRLANDHEALMAMDANTGFEEIIPNNTIPCLLYIGDKDPNYPQTEQCAKEMPNTHFFVLPGMAHGEAFRAVEEGLPHVKNFLAEMSHR